MEKKLIIISYFTAIFLLSSCWKEEIPVERVDRGGVKQITIPIGNEYGNQIWYNLERQEIVRTAPKELWDISAEKNENGQFVIRLNSSLASSVFKTTTTIFDEVTQAPASNQFKYDESSGGTDTLAIGVLSTFGEIFILDRGFSSAGLPLGRLKLQFTHAEGNTLYLRHSALNGNNDFTGFIEVNENYNTVGYSFTSREMLFHEPVRNDWHLCFTQYTHLFYEPYQPYLVVGVLSNASTLDVAELNTIAFDQINADVALTTVYSTRVDEIGYDWKFYNFDLAQFTIEENKFYLLQTVNALLYRMRFIDFYNEAGERGYPMFELVSI